MIKLRQHKRTYWLWVRRVDGNYSHRMIRISDRSYVPASVEIDGIRRSFQPEKAYWFTGWSPYATQGFWTPLKDFIETVLIQRQVIKRFILFYEPGDPKPVDRISGVGVTVEINPRLSRVLTNSKLYDNYLKGLRYGSSVNMTMILLVLIGCGALLLVMYGMGYFHA